jgi:hypothetical protein
MSAFGTKLTSRDVRDWSAYEVEADVPNIFATSKNDERLFYGALAPPPFYTPKTQVRHLPANFTCAFFRPPLC